MEKIYRKMREIEEKEFMTEEFKKDLDDLFETLNEKIQENNIILEKIDNNSGLVLINVMEELEKIRCVFFKFCCEFSKKEIFDIAFCYYRDLLIELAKVEEKIDDICINIFDEKIKECTMEIQENKKNIKVINNDNINEHIALHKHNEPFYKNIEELETKRKEMLRR